jgi:hypothetical protein
MRVERVARANGAKRIAQANRLRWLTCAMVETLFRVCLIAIQRRCDSTRNGFLSQGCGGGAKGSASFPVDLHRLLRSGRGRIEFRIGKSLGNCIEVFEFGRFLADGRFQVGIGRWAASGLVGIRKDGADTAEDWVCPLDDSGKSRIVVIVGAAAHGAAADSQGGGTCKAGESDAGGQAVDGFHDRAFEKGEA